jgi:hypothetical protein
MRHYLFDYPRGKLVVELSPEMPNEDQDKVVNGICKLSNGILWGSYDRPVIDYDARVFSPDYYIKKYQREFTNYLNSGDTAPDTIKEKLEIANEIKKILLKYPLRSEDADNRRYQEEETEESNELPTGDRLEDLIVGITPPGRVVYRDPSQTIRGTATISGDGSGVIINANTIQASAGVINVERGNETSNPQV